jgi:hypothetical protein
MSEAQGIKGFIENLLGEVTLPLPLPLPLTLLGEVTLPLPLPLALLAEVSEGQVIVFNPYPYPYPYPHPYSR